MYLKRALLALLVCCLSQALQADERSELKAKMAEAVAAGDRSRMADCARQAGALGMSPGELKAMITTKNPKLETYQSNFSAACSDLRKAELFLNGIDKQIANARLGMKAQAIKEGFKKLVEEQAPKPEDGVYKVIPGVGQYQEIKGVLEAMAAFGKAAKKGIMTIEDLKAQRANAKKLVEELGWNGDSKGLCHVLNKDLVDYQNKFKGWDSDFDRQYKDGVDKRKYDDKKRKEKQEKLKKDAEDAKKRETDRLQAETAKKNKDAGKAKPTSGKATSSGTSKPATSTATHTVEAGWVKDKNGTSKVTYVKDAKGNVLQVIHTHYDKNGKEIGKNVYPGGGGPAVTLLPAPPKIAKTPMNETRDRNDRGDRGGGRDSCSGNCK